MKKMLIGILMIGSLIFVGCSNQEVSEDVTISSTADEDVEYKDDDRAVLKYGEDLALNNGKVKLKDYLTEGEMDRVTIKRYEKAKTLDESYFKTDFDIAGVMNYLTGITNVFPGTDTSVKPHNVEETLNKYMSNDNEAQDSNKETNKIQEEPTKRCCKCGKVMTPEQIKLYGDTCTDCLTDTCEYCGTEKPLDSQCPNCGGMDNNLERLPYHTKYIHCDNCGNQTFDWINGECIECGYTE